MGVGTDQIVDVDKYYEKTFDSDYWAQVMDSKVLTVMFLFVCAEKLIESDRTAVRISKVHNV